MKTSHREVYALLVNAARGLGYEAGNAEDLAGAGAWLTVRGYPGVEALVDLQRAEAPTPTPTPGSPSPPGVEPGRDRSELLVERSSTGRHGPGLIDLLAAGDSIDRLRIVGVDSPLLLIGLCAAVAAELGLRFRVEADGATHYRVDGHDCHPDPSPLLDGGRQLVISCEHAEPATATAWPSQEADVADAAWSAANRLAALTYVPADDRSRATGAGAGLTDND